MKRFLLVCLFLVSGAIFAQEQIINSFDEAPADSTYWAFYQNPSADSTVSYMNYEFVADPVHEGAGAMQVDYSVQNAESWGGFVKLEHWNPDSNGTYDWSLYDSLSLWYYNAVPQSDPGQVSFRVNLHDVSDAADGNHTYDVGEVEYWYSFHFIMDSEPGWNEIKLSLTGDTEADQSGDGMFHLTDWSGIQGNRKLDLNKIKGFSFELSIPGSGAGNNSEGQIIFDKLALYSPAVNPLVLFNGAAVPGDVTLGGDGWSDNAFTITEEDAYTPGTKSIKWTFGSDWAVWGGLVWTYNDVKNLAYRWGVDSLKFKIKAAAGTGPMKAVILDDDTDGEGPDLMFEAGYVIEESMVGYDGTWKEVAIPLRDFSRFDGGWDGSGTAPGEMDSSRVIQVKLLMAPGATPGSVVYLDDVWTGNPEFDVIAPVAPGLVSVAPDSYANLVTWTDVPGEEFESYDVYYSFDPITDVTAEGVEVVALGVAENEQLATHVLRAPLTDQALTYYYAVVCKDAAGNSSPIAPSDPTSTMTTNDGEGVPVINNGAPASFAVDGTFTEWNSIRPFLLYPEEGISGSVVTNQEIDDSLDCSMRAYLAVDQDYLYFAFDITDDINEVDTTIDTWLTDGADLFIGLYNWHGPSHSGLEKGAEPDYHFRFLSNKVIIDNVSGVTVLTPGDDYIFKEKFPSGYAIEGRMSFESLSTLVEGNPVFTPILGQRIPIDFSVNDDDGAEGHREGILTYSPYNEDLSYTDVGRWLYTWVGDAMVDVDNEEGIQYSFELSQNYPNPFNPSTTINYSIPVSGMVTLKIYNVLGQEVKTLVNKEQFAGMHTISFDASNLASGVYIYRLSSGNFVNTKKMMLLK